MMTDLDIQQMAAARGYPVLHKPVRPARLRALVQQTLVRSHNPVA